MRGGELFPSFDTAPLVRLAHSHREDHTILQYVIHPTTISADQTLDAYMFRARISTHSWQYKINGFPYQISIDVRNLSNSQIDHGGVYAGEDESARGVNHAQTKQQVITILMMVASKVMLIVRFSNFLPKPANFPVFTTSA